MARKKKTPQPIQMPQRHAAPTPAEEPERIEKRGHLDQPLLLLTMMLLGMGLLCLFSASYATAYDDFDGNSAYFIIRQGVFAAGGVVIMLIASGVAQFPQEAPWVQGMFMGVNGCVAGLIAATAWRMGKKVLKGIFPLLIALAAFTGMVYFRWNPGFLMLGAVPCGIIYAVWQMRHQVKKWEKL